MLSSSMFKDKVIELQRGFDGKRLILGIDRMDYVKGIPHKLIALEKFFHAYPQVDGIPRPPLSLRSLLVQHVCSYESAAQPSFFVAVGEEGGSRPDRHAAKERHRTLSEAPKQGATFDLEACTALLVALSTFKTHLLLAP